MSAFNPNQTINTSISLVASYPGLSVSNIKTNPNYSISGSCQPSSSSNITYTQSNSSSEYKANQLYIIGAGPGSKYPLHNVSGAENVTGELIIKNVSTNNDNPIYMCYLLSSITSGTSSTTQVDSILNTAATSSSSPIVVNLNADTKQTSSSTKYIVYTSSVINPGATVVICTTPINVSSSVLFPLQNNAPLFDMSATIYSVIDANVEGSWMECDYVPIDSEEVMTYNLPINSGVAKDQSTFNSLQTIVLFIVFFFISVFAYFLIPSVYSWFANKVVQSGEDETDKKNRIFIMDCILSGVLGGLSAILIGVGAFGPENPNNGDVLLSGFCIGIIYLIGYIIIQSKKTNDDNFISGIDYTNE